MNTLVRNAVLWLAGAALMVGASVASAAQATGTITVSASVAKNCTVAASTLPFNTYDPSATSDLDVATTLEVSCTGNTPFTVALNDGSTATSFAPRLMTNGVDTNYMQYNLYTNVGRTIVFGDGTSGTVTAAGSGQGLGNPQTVNIYGRIPQNQTSLAAGTYTDTISVTVTY